MRVGEPFELVPRAVKKFDPVDFVVMPVRA